MSVRGFVSACLVDEYGIWNGFGVERREKEAEQNSEARVELETYT